MVQSKSEKLILLTGNEAVGRGALKAGLRFFASYPMTPATSIMHFLASRQKKNKIIVKQVEDEIAAINMVIGASVAGARSMTATSGGGFALMSEALGFGSMIETPFVCVIVSRPGPATGMPTWTGQADLRLVMHAGQDEFPRIILAPGDALEAYKLTFDAFNLADKYKLPVLILSDKLLGESYFTIQASDLRIIDMIQKRDTCSKIFLANSDEHNAAGYSDDSAENRVKQMIKRMSKLENIIKDKALGLPNWYGPKKADLTLICWGSTKGVVYEFISTNQDKKINMLHFNYLYPLDVQRIRKELNKIKSSICLEGNYSGQFADFLCEKTGYKCDKKINKFDGRPFFVQDLIKKINE